MSKIVLDASVLIAILNGEPGAEIFTKQPALLASAAISAVNVCEAYSKLVSLGTDPEQAWETVTAPIPEIVAFEADQAKTVGQLIAVTRSKGLSLGDRACLGLGMALKAPVYTTDRAWKSLNVGVKIHVIR